jgi:tetratricopeptide (TPR) repeat protein
MRFRMTREIDIPDIAIHLDFLHPARHLWRFRFSSLRLADLERFVLRTSSLGWSREYDIDPTHIPSIYFDYLRGGPTEPLGGVFRHNRMDLRGLAALAAHIMTTAADVDTIAPNQDSGLELYGLSRLLAQNGEYLRARDAYQRALASSLPDEVDQRARYELARLSRRHKDFDRRISDRRAAQRAKRTKLRDATEAGSHSNIAF